MLKRSRWFLALAAVLAAMPVAAHHVDVPEPAKLAPGPLAIATAVQGHVNAIVVENRVTGTTRNFTVLVAGDGHRYMLSGPSADGLLAGDFIAVTGKVEGGALFPDGITFLPAGAAAAAALTAAPTVTVEGTLRLGHADNFDGTPSEFFYSVVTDDGRHVKLPLATLLGGLDNGARVWVSGAGADTVELAAERIVVTGPATTKAAAAIAPKAGPVTTSYIVLPVKFPTNAAAPFTYGADPFTPAALNNAVFGPTPTSNVKAYYNEVSYGQQSLSGTVADDGAGGFLLANVAKPATCDISAIATAAEAAATARGYDLNSYTGRLYVFNNLSCPWSGLAYVGWPHAYSNNTTNLLVIAHELGHNFGLAHAASLDCGANVIGGTCTSSEYGDPFDVMGNNRAMHFSSSQKAILNWLPAGSVATHASGTQVYTLSPIEAAGGTMYAVKVQAAANRTYWIEYRQPIGFDAGLSGFPNNGAQIRVANPFESLCSNCYDDTEFLDFTPATTAFTDGSLLAGQSYTDSTYSFTVNVTSATPTALTLQIISGTGTPTTTTVTASPNPSVAGGYVQYTASVTGATTPIGAVAFADGATTIPNCSEVTLGAAGTATCTTNVPGVAGSPHVISAAYLGSIGFAPSSGTVSQVVNKAATKTTIGTHTPNPVYPGMPLAVAATVAVTSPGSGTPGGTVTVSDGTANCVITLPAAGCSLTPLSAGTKTLTAVYSGDANYTGSTSAGVTHTVSPPVASGTFGAISGDAQSAHVGSAFTIPLRVRVLDASSNPVAGSTVAWTTPTIGASATLSATTSTTDAQGYAQVTATANGMSGPFGVITGNGGRIVSFNLTNTVTSSAGLACAASTATVQDLIEQDYLGLLQRASDVGGKAYWTGEATRLCPLGIDPKQTFLVLGNVFLNGSEYASLGRSDSQFVSDVYVAFLNRTPDSGGLTYWSGQLGSGLPRNVVLNSFLFAPEFGAVMQSLFGTGTSRSEVSTIVDLYGGLFRRLPDSSGFTYWLTQFRQAQCAGPSAVALRVDDITKQFLSAPEYVGRIRSNSEYVQDLYYSFLRRGGDLAGFNYWVALLNAGQTRENLRQQFLASPEMQGRITQIAAETCLP
jgi:hypothetical protein